MDSRPHILFQAPPITAGDDLGFGPLGGGVANQPPATVKVESLTPAEVAEARQQPGMVPAPAIRTKLIEPVEPSSGGGGAVTAPAAGTVAWGVEAVGAVSSPFDGSGIKVAVLDTGIDAMHEAFAGSGAVPDLTIVQRDFTGQGNGDIHGHGTHCAGTILGRDIGGMRIGVARGVTELFIGKVLGANGGTTQSLAEGILWALSQGASVISMSIGIDFPGEVHDLVASGMPVQAATSRALEGYRDNVRLFEAVTAYLVASGPFGSSALIVAASGNESRRTGTKPYTIDVSPPAAAMGIISVAAVGQPAAQTFAIAPFSNTGAKIAGPGVSIMSAQLGGGVVEMSGTSMATPHVAGVAALWAQQRIQVLGQLDIGQLSDVVVASGQPLPGLTGLDVGAGLVQAPQT